MKAIIVSEENHGGLCIAKNYKSAIRWLIDNHWIDSYTTIWDACEAIEIPIQEIAGENWEETILNEWDIEKFNYEFDGCFCLEETDLVEY